MIKITFKNVGQGDSIILEWEKKGTERIAIIDCNKNNNTNPVLEHIQKKRYSEIEFMLLTHPHLDHYSGFLDVLKYCKINSIRVKNFIHTAARVPEFLIATSTTIESKQKIYNLFQFISENIEELKCNCFPIQSDSISSKIKLKKKLYIQFLAPSFKELKNFSKKVKYKDTSKDYPQAHWLCTIIKIGIKNDYVLLTSDVLEETLLRIDIKQSKDIDGSLLLGQSPHHGSESNHNNTFWKKRKVSWNTPIVFSVGENKYDHPSQNVVDFFDLNGFRIHSTNKIGPLNGINKTNSKNIRYKQIALNVFSNISPVQVKDRFQGDQIFDFQI